MEFLLGAWLENTKPVPPKGTKKGRVKVSATVKGTVGKEVRPFMSAGDVLRYGLERSWLTGDQ